MKIKYVRHIYLPTRGGSIPPKIAVRLRHVGSVKHLTGLLTLSHSLSLISKAGRPEGEPSDPSNLVPSDPANDEGTLFRCLAEERTFIPLFWQYAFKSAKILLFKVPFACISCARKSKETRVQTRFFLSTHANTISSKTKEKVQKDTNQ